MITALGVALAAGGGAVCRYLLDQVVQHRHESLLPWGTFAVNATGSFLLGLVTGLTLHHGLAATPAAVLSAGFCAGYTTWSTWAWESLILVEDGARGAALLNVVGSLGVGLLAAGAGLAVNLL